jgi:hypothetical protein
VSVRHDLIESILEPGVFDRADPDIEAKQLEAARELFAERRGQIGLLRRRAEEAGVDEIKSMRDLVPLLFAHTAYKSYPQSFIDQGRWVRMLQWMQTLSVDRTDNVNVDGVRGVDDWIHRLREGGHIVLATSGSSGKCSFLNHTRGDSAMKRRHASVAVGWPFVRGAKDRACFFLGPSEGPNSAIEASQNNAANFGRPGDVHFLTDEPLLISEVSRAAALRTRMADGTATPGEIEAFENEAREKAARMDAALDAMTESILARRHEPIYLTGMWAQHMMIIERARKVGVPDGDFNPHCIVSAGGGVKGVALPPDYKDQVARFYGDVIRPTAYGMTEMAQMMPRCEHMRYHRPPGLIWLLLDAEGERLLTAQDGPNGVVEGRFGFLDLLYEGRWGGLITGDKVTIDFASACPCGRPGPTILDTITRFSQSGDDHIGCAGTIDSYIRSSLTQ